MIVLLFKMMFQDILLDMMKYVPDHFKRKEMYNEAVRNNPYVLMHVHDHFKTQEMCNKAIEVSPWQLNYISDQYKTQRMCDKAVEYNPFSLQFVPDWFVTQEQLKLWHNSDDWHGDNEVIEWYKGYKKRKAWKAKVKEELLPIAWHPSRYWEWLCQKMKKKKI